MVSGQREATNLCEGTTGLFPGKGIAATKLPRRWTTFKMSEPFSELFYNQLYRLQPKVTPSIITYEISSVKKLQCHE